MGLHAKLPLPSLPPLSIRVRLTIWYGAVLAITIAVFGVFVHATLERNLQEEFDRSLQQRARDVNGGLLAFRVPLRDQRVLVPPDADAFAQAGTFVQIVDLNGQVLSASANLGAKRLPFDDKTVSRAQNKYAYFETVDIDRQSLRIFNAPLQFGEMVVGLLQVGRPLRPVEAALEQLRLLMAIGGLAAVMLSALIGTTLARVALRPIDRLTQTAHEIGEAQDFGQRVEYEGPADEVGRLAETFNAMLGRLQEAYGHVEDSLAAQRRFVSDASHELRTPLTTIRGNAALLRRVANMDPLDREEALQQISGEAERMSRLVTDLLTLARADGGLHIARRPVVARPIVEEVYRQLRMLSNGRLVELGELAEGMVRADPDYLKQVLLILADNALKYTPVGGRVTLSVVQAGKWLELNVADTGVGIAPEDLPHIFDRFYRADHSRSSGGTGLGLAIARWIVEEHHGRMAVASEPGHGSTFTVRLRLLGERQQQEAPPDPTFAHA